MKVIIVGAGGTARDLLRRLGPSWEVTIVDIDPERLALATKVREVTTLEGDGSSKVVLERLPLADADAVVAAANSDEVNLEVCRLARDAGVSRIAATAAASERLPEYRELNVPAYAPSRLTAHRLELALGTHRVVSADFAAGKAAAIEVRITHDAPVAGRTLAELHSARWLVAAILRGGRLIVPHGDTRLQAGDLVTVVGSAVDYALILRAFVSDRAAFPAEYGRQVAVAARNRADLAGPVTEAVALVRNSSAESLLVVHEDSAEATDDGDSIAVAIAEVAAGVNARFRPVTGDLMKALAQACADESVGVVVLPMPGGGVLRQRFALVRSLRFAQSLGVPVLYSRGLSSYEQIIVGAPETDASRDVARAAIDLASAAGSTITGVAAVPQAGGATARDAALGAAALLREEAAAVGVATRRRVRRGPRSRLMSDEAAAGGLVVLPMPTRTPTVFQPGTAGNLLLSTPASVLLVWPEHEGED